MTVPEQNLPTREQLFAIAFAACQNHDVADEVTDEAMFRGVQHEHKLGPDSLPWFRRVIKNLTIDRFREPRPVSIEDLAHGEVLVRKASSPADELIQRELSELTMNAVRSLPEIEREPLTLQFLAGKPMREVSEILGVPVSTLEGRCRRGLLKLRGILGEASIQGVPALVVLGGAAKFSAPGISATAASHSVRKIAQMGARSAAKATAGPGALVGLLCVTVLALSISWWALPRAGARTASASVARVAPLERSPSEVTEVDAVQVHGAAETREVAPLEPEPEPPSMMGVDEGTEQTPALASDAQATSESRRFEIRITANGRGVEELKVLAPLLEPRVARRAQVPPVQGIVVSEPDETGRIVFALPPGKGEWMFRVTVPSRRVALRIFSEATSPDLGAPIDFELSSVRLNQAGKLWAHLDMNPENTVLVSNLRPGVWAYSLRPYGDSVDDWNFPGVVPGPYHLRQVSYAYDPALWTLVDPPLNVSVGAEPTVIDLEE